MSKNTPAIILFLMLILVSDLHARDGSRFSARVYFTGKRYGSDEGILTNYYSARGDDPSLYDTQCRMQYHFDSKWGIGAGMALSYVLNDHFELDCGVGYTNVMMEITQTLRYFRNAYVGGPRGFSSTEYREADEYDYDVFNLRPGVNLYISSGAIFRPFIGARLDVKFIRADASLLFARPYVTEENGQYHLHIGWESDIEELHIKGSEVLFGMGLESGIEIRGKEGISFIIGIFYDIHPKKALDDFGGMIEDDEQRTEIKNVGYTYGGMEFNTFGASLALKYSF